MLRTITVINLRLKMEIIANFVLAVFKDVKKKR